MARGVVAFLGLGLAGLFVLSLALWGRFGPAIALDTFLSYCF
jgi:hypothetical protein